MTDDETQTTPEVEQAAAPAAPAVKSAPTDRESAAYAGTPRAAPLPTAAANASVDMASASTTVETRVMWKSLGGQGFHDMPTRRPLLR